MRGMLTSAAVAIASLAWIASANLAHAATSTGPAAASAVRASQDPVRLAANTKRKKIEQPQTNWLNPQPEPPMSGTKPVQGGTWLNPQPEPPRPATTKKLQ